MGTFSADRGCVRTVDGAPPCPRDVRSRVGSARDRSPSPKGGDVESSTVGSVRNPRTPLESVIESYLLHSQDKKPRTREFYTQQLGSFVRWLRANDYEVVLGDVDPNVVSEYLLTRQRVSAFTGRAASGTLKAFGSWLARMAIRHDRGASVLAQVRGPRVPQDVRRSLTDREVAEVLAAAKKTRNPERDYALVMVALDCGLRLNELRELRLADVDLAEMSLTVRAETSKSNRTRQVRLGREAARALDRYTKDFREEAEAIPAAARETVFLSDDGLPLTRRGVGLIFERVRSRSGVRGLMAHVCRHTWATNYRRRDCGDLYDLKYEGGWSDLKMVGRYAHQGPLAERRRGPSPMDAMLSDRKSEIRRSVRRSVALRVVAGSA